MDSTQRFSDRVKDYTKYRPNNGKVLLRYETRVYSRVLRPGYSL